MRLLVENMGRQRVSPSEVFGEMHKVGLYRLEQVRWGILETDGKMSFIPAAGASTFHASGSQKEPIG